MDYAEYLASDQWQVVAREAKARSEWRCGLCGRARVLEVHHVRYDHLGNERANDVIALCSECHRKHHGTLTAARKRAERGEWLPFESDCPTGDDLN